MTKDKRGPAYKEATTTQVEAVKESEAACVVKEAKRRRSGPWKEFACARCFEPELAKAVNWGQLRAHFKEK